MEDNKMDYTAKEFMHLGDIPFAPIFDEDIEEECDLDVEGETL